jgi:hypothetical protein
MAAVIVMMGCGQIESASQTAQAIASCSDDSPEYNCQCAGCGANGVSQDDWNALFAEADRVALDRVHAWDWPADGPIALCAPGGNGSCTLAPQWHRWIDDRDKHRSMMRHLVQVIAPKTYPVHDGANTYYGELGLAPGALLASWSYADQEIVSAAMLALLDAVHGVPVCLKTERTPNNCVGSAAYFHESTTFGRTFRVHHAAISGGAAAPDPTKNPRFRTVRGDSAVTFRYDDGHCEAPTGNGVKISVASCVDDVQTWGWPVLVLTPTDPSWYYDKPGPDFHKPAGSPEAE